MTDTTSAAIIDPASWPALGQFAVLCRSRINHQILHGAKPRKADRSRPFALHDIGDLPAFGREFDAICNGWKLQLTSLVDMMKQYPALLQENAVADGQAQVDAAAQKLVVLFMVARMHAHGADARFVASPRLRNDIYRTGLENLCLHANRALSDLAQRYTAFFTALPEFILESRKRLQSGEISELTFQFDPQPDTASLTQSVERLNLLIGAVTQAMEEQRAAKDEISMSGDSDAAAVSAGMVYAMVNPSMPGLVKVGKTRRSGEVRAAELHGTGVPTPFIVVYELATADCDATEQLVHAALDPYRVNGRREFFAVTPQAAIDVMLQIGARAVPVDTVSTPKAAALPNRP